jgi:hypothetical protein
MEVSRICVLILSTQVKSYGEFIKAVENGWYKDFISKGIKVFFYSGGHGVSNLLDGKEIQLNTDDSILNSYRKFYSAQKFILEKYSDVDLIFRTNLSSYIDVNKFVDFCNSCELTSRTYHGYRGSANVLSEVFYGNKYLHFLFKKLNLGKKVDFFSGAGFFIGVDLCKELNCVNGINYLVDDVEIGRQLSKIHCDFVDIAYQRILITDDFEKMRLEDFEKMDRQDLLFHYKFKTANRSIDVGHISNFHNIEYRKSVLTI